MKNLITVFTFLIAAAFTPSCAPSNTNIDNCFEGLDSITAEPIETDTVVIFDPKTFAESCYKTDFYLAVESGPDSILKIREKTIGLIKSDDCYVLLSVKQEISNCNN